MVAVLLAVVARRPAGTAAVALAAGAVLARWGSTSLDALAGAQAVLGPAVNVGSGTEAASAVCAGAALVLATPAIRWQRRLRPPPAAAIVAAPFAASAALVVAGPAPGGALAARVIATVVALAVALGVGRSASWPAVRRMLPFVAAGTGVAALALAAVS